MIKLNKYSLIAVLFVHAILIRIRLVYDSKDLISFLNTILLLYTVVSLLSCKGLFKRYFKLNVIVVLFCCSILFSSLLQINRLGLKQFFATIRYCMILVNAFGILEIAQYHGKIKSFLEMMLCVLIVYLVFTDILAIIIPGEKSDGRVYLIGNKFNVTNIHLLTVAIAQMLGKKRLSNILVGLTLAISLYINCLTGFMGCVFYLLMQVLSNKQRRFVSAPLVALGILAVCGSALLISDAVLHLSLVSKMIAFFEKEKTMGSRMLIYSNIFEQFMARPFWGIGYNNAYSVLVSANTQNGIFENLIQFGVVGTGGLLLAIVYVLHRFRKTQNMVSFPFLCIVIVKFIQASVEVTLGQSFWVVLALLGTLSIDEYIRSGTDYYGLIQRRKKYTIKVRQFDSAERGTTWKFR